MSFLTTEHILPISHYRMINTDKLASDILFIMLPAFSIIITMAWRELLLEYINSKYDHLTDLERKTLVTLMVSVMGITIFYIFREDV